MLCKCTVFVKSHSLDISLVCLNYKLVKYTAALIHTVSEHNLCGEMSNFISRIEKKPPRLSSYIRAYGNVSYKVRSRA